MSTPPFRIASFPSNYTAICGVSNFAPRPSCPTPGFVPELLNFVLTYMNVPYEIIPTHEFMHLENGDMNGILRDLVHGKYDTVAHFIEPFVTAALRKQNLTIKESFPVLPSDAYGFVTKTVSEGLLDSAWLPFEIYEPMVWALLLCWYLPALFLLKHLKLKFSSDGWRAFAWVTAFFFALFANLYKGKLLAELLGVHSFTPYSDPWQIVSAIQNHKLIPIVNYAFDDQAKNLLKLFAENGSQFEAAYVKALMENGVSYHGKTEAEIISAIVEHDNYIYASAFESSMILYKTVSCNLAFVSASSGRRPFIFGVWQNSSYFEKFNQALIAGQDFRENLLEKYRKIINRNAFCEEEGKTKETDCVESLSLLKMWGSFAFMQFGLVVSVLCLFLEFLVWHIMRLLKQNPKERRNQAQRTEIEHNNWFYFARDRLESNLEESLTMIRKRHLDKPSLGKMRRLVDQAKSDILVLETEITR